MADNSKSTFVTRPSLPPLEEFIPYLKNIWESGVVTNNGAYHRLFEAELSSKLCVENVSLVNNATIGLLIAIKALKLTGEVITTPFSFVATSNVLEWSGIKPVYIDIKTSTFNLDPYKIEEAITENTSAILPVNCYGNPCDYELIQHIADKHNLKIIYDAAHSFMAKKNGAQLVSHGDFSVLSFHGTKVFNTFEGGAVISKTKELKNLIDSLKNFGIADETTLAEPGINGKMSEFNAALGCIQMKYIDEAIQKRKFIHEKYIYGLNQVEGITLPQDIEDHQKNYSYFPILIQKNYPTTRDELYEILRAKNIYARRYFYPSIPSFTSFKKYLIPGKESLPITSIISEAILCLPIFPDLDLETLSEIISIIKNPKGYLLK
jgi:dTDP-4-amino-4,6-dideoxygalactose transaminase